MRFEFEISNSFEAFSKVETSNSNIICSIITDKELLGADPTIPADNDPDQGIRYIKRAVNCKMPNIGGKLEDWIKPYYAIAQPLISVFRENYQRLIPTVYYVNASILDTNNVVNKWMLKKSDVTFGPEQNNDRFIFINNNDSTVNNGYYCLDVIYNASNMLCKAKAKKTGSQDGTVKDVDFDNAADLRELIGLDLNDAEDIKKFVDNFSLFKEFIIGVFMCLNGQCNSNCSDNKDRFDETVDDGLDYLVDDAKYKGADLLVDKVDTLTSIGDVEAFKFINRPGKVEVVHKAIGEDGLPFEYTTYEDIIIPDIFIIFNNRNLVTSLNEASSNYRLTNDIDLSEFEIIDAKSFALKYNKILVNDNDKIYLKCSQSDDTDTFVYYVHLSKLNPMFFDLFSICLQLLYLEKRNPVAVINVSHYFEIGGAEIDMELARVLPYFCDFMKKYAKEDAVVLFIGVREGSLTHEALLKYQEQNCK